MKNQNQNISTSTVGDDNGEGPLSSDVVGVPSVGGYDPDSLSALRDIEVGIESEGTPRVRKFRPPGFFRRVDFVLAGLVLLGTAAVLFSSSLLGSHAHRQFDRADVTTRYAPQTIPLTDFIGIGQAANLQNRNVIVNGELTANGGLVITPSLQPSAPVDGQVYFDKDTNQLGFYNGSGFVLLGGEPGETVKSLGGLTGQVTLGGGLTVVGSQLLNAGVLSLGGANGIIGLGDGLSLADNTLQNAGVIHVASGSPNVTITDNGDGSLSVSVTSGAGTVTSDGGNIGSIPVFTASQNVEDSLLTQSGSAIALAGNLNISGTLALGAALSVSNGGIGTGSLAANGVLIGQGAGAITSVVAGSPGLCLVSGAGSPVWSPCSPSSSTVNSLNGLTGTLTLANATGLVNTVTIDDASTSNKGIAQFNVTNFSAVGGTVNTIQNISASSSPTFNGLTLSGNLTVQGGTSTLGTFTQAGSLVVHDGTSNTVTIVAANLSADRVYTLPDAGGNATLCVTSGNCIGGTGGAPNGSNYLVTSVDGTLTNERALAAGSNINLTDGGANGNMTVATIQNPVFTTSVTTPALQSSGALVLTSAGGNAVTIDSASTIELQDSTNVTGNLDVSVALNVGSGNAFAVNASGVITAAAGINSSGSIIFSSLDCSANGNGGALTTDSSGQLMCSDDDGGAGGGLSGSGSSGTIPVFNGATSLTNSIITQSGTTITVAGDLTLTTALTVANGGTGATSFTSKGVLYGNGSSALQVTGAGTGGQVLIANASGTPTFATFSGDVTVSNTGTTAIQPDSVALGTDTTGSFVSNLGGLTGLSASGNSGEGSTPSLSVIYGSIANTAVQGNVTLTCPSGAGNLTGGGTSITLGTGGACGNLSTVNNPTFTTSVTTPNLIFTGTGSNGSVVVGNLGQGTVYTLPDPAQAAADICLSTGNCSAVGAAGGDLTGTYPNPTIAKFQGTDVNIVSPLAGHILVYNGTSSAWENHAVSSDIAISETGVATIQSNAVALGADTTGNYVIGLTAGNGISVSGSAGEAWSPSVAVLYGSAANTAVQGNTSITLTAGTNLTGGGSITLGSGGTVTLNVANAPIFSGTLTVQGASVTIGAAAQQGSLILNDGSSNIGTIRTAGLANDRIYTLPDPGADATICVSSGNCAGSGSGVTTSGGTPDRVAKFTGTQAIADSSLSDDGTTVTVNGTANLVVQGGTSTIGTTTQAGTLVLSDGSSNTVSIVAAGLAANRVYTLPDAGANADICLSSGNCVGGGGGSAPSSADYLVLSVNGSLSNERVLTAGNNISFNDGGANGALTVATVQNPTFTTSVTTPALQSSGALTISSAAGNTVSINAGTTIELQDSTNVTGSLDVSVALKAGTSDAFQVDSGGAITAATGVTSSGTIIFSDLDCSGNLNGGALTTNSSGQLMCSDDAGGGSTITGSGTSGTIPVFNGTQTITDSIITQSGTTITIAGDLSLNTALTVANGGTGATSFTTRGLLYGNGTGTVQVTAAGTGGQVLIANSSGVPTFATFSGDVTVSNTGVTTIQADSVALGTDTTGSYVANLGSLTGLSATGNGGEGSTPTLSVAYGSSANTAVQGNISLTCPSGTGNLTGGGTSITLGSGGACGNIGIANNPTFTTSVTTAELILTGAGSGGSLVVDSLGQPTTYTLPDPGGDADICLSTGNCTAIGAAGGDLTGSYPNPTIAGLQGTTLTINTPLAGHILIYNGTNGAWENHAVSGDVAFSETGAATIQANSVALTTDTTGSYVASLGSLTGLSTTGNSGEGSAPTLSVTYGSSANTAVQGNVGLTCPSGTGNLSGGGTSITLGTGGACGNISITNSPTFTGTLTVNTITPSSAMTIGDIVQTLSLQGNATTTLAADDSGNTTTIGFVTPTADTTIKFPALPAGTSYVICTNSGNCGGVGATLQTAYDNSSTPEITLDPTQAALTIRDNSTPLVGNLFEVQNNSGSTTYFAVDNSGISATGAITASGNIDTTTGAIKTAGTDRISNSGNLVNIGTIATSGAINSQTISSAANFTGTVTIQGTNALTLGATGSATGAILFKGATAASGTITLVGQANPGTRTITLPDESGIVCTSAASSPSNCTNFAPATGSTAYATRQLDNLTGVAINAALGFSSSQAANINFNGAASGIGNTLTITGQTAGGTGNNGGAISIQGGTPTTTGAGGTVSILGGAAAGATGTNGGVTIDAGNTSGAGTGMIAIGNNGSAQDVRIASAGSTIQSVLIGSAANAGSVTAIDGSAINVGNSNNNHAISIGTGTGIQTLTVGSLSSTSILNLQSGRGGLNVQSGTTAGVVSGNIELGSGQQTGNSSASGEIGLATGDVVAGASSSTSGDIFIRSGNAGSSTNGSSGSITIRVGTKSGSGTLGSINIGTGSGGETVQIGNTANAVTQTIAIGNNNTASSTTNVTIGSGSSASGGTTTLQAKGALSLTGGAASTWDVNGTLSLQTTNNGAITTGTGLLTLQGGSTTSRTLTANSGSTQNVTNINFTSPADTSGTNVSQGLNITPTIGNATAGTNTANIINLEAVTGDAQVTLNGIKIGALTGTIASETAINIGSGWDNVLSVNGTAVINGSGVVQVAGGGTGATSLTSNGVLYGNNTGTVQATLAGTTGQCLVGATGAAPSWASCSGLVTLQNAYDASTTPEIVVNGTNGALTIRRDNAAAVSNLLDVQSFDGLTTYFQAHTSGISVTGSVNVGTGTVIANTFRSIDQTSGSTNSDAVVYTSGQVAGATSNTGAVTVRSGASTSSGNTGALNLNSGDATSGNSGNINIQVGTATGTLGQINIGSAASSTQASTTHIADTTDATGTQAVTIGSTAKTSNTLALQGNTVTLLTNSSSGTILAKSGTNSTAAFEIQNAGGANQFLVNTSDSNSNLITNPSAEVNTTGWNARTGTSPLTRTTTAANVYYGVGAIQAVNGTTLGAGVNYPIQLSPSTTYTIRAMVQATVNGGSGILTFGYAADGSDETTWATTTAYPGAAGTSWYEIDESFTTPGTVNAGAYIFIKQNDTTARTLYIDGLRAEVGTTNYQYREGQINIGNSATPVIIGGSPSNVPTSTPAALFVQQTRNGAGLIVRATPESDVNRPTVFQVQDSSANVLLNVDQNTVSTYVSGGSGFWNSAALNINQYDPFGGGRGLVITGASTTAQSGNLLEIMSGTGSSRTNQNMFTVGGAGEVTARNYSDSTAGFQVQNSAGNSLLNVDTTNASVSVSSAAKAGLLAAKVDYTTATSPYGTATADFNKDGAPDLAVVNNGSTSVSVFINNGSGGFAAKVDYTTATNPRSVVAADLDKDGDIDLAVTNNGSTSFSVFLNNGSGTFAAKVDYTTGSGPYGITSGDFDKDGDTDVAVTNNGTTTLSVFLNNGNGTFAAKADYTTATNPFSITAADFDKDGDIDLAESNSGSTSMSVFLNNGAGTFAAKVDYTTGSAPNGMASGDLNKDGNPDLVAVNSGPGTASVFIGNGAGAFATKVDYATGATPRAVSLADFNKDGLLDLAVSDEGPDTVSILLNNGNGTFGARTSYAAGSNPTGIATGDFDKNGNMDVATANNTGTSASVLLNATLGVSPITNPTLSIYSSGVNDSLQIKTSDNKKLLSVDARGNTTIGDQSDIGGGLFVPRVDYAGATKPTYTAYADFNKDGYTDVVATDGAVTGAALSVFINNGNGTFATRVDYAANNNSQMVTTGDFDKDGDIDMAVSNNASNNISVFLNNGNGTFAAKVDYTTGTSPVGLAAADLDKDGDIDLVSTNNNAAANSVSVFLNNGDGTFAAKADYTTGTQPSGIALADYDKDGDIDIAATNFGAATVSILLNNGAGTFAAKVDYTVGSSPRTVAAADYDKDGDIDLAVANNVSDTVSILLNNGAGTFAAKVDYTTGTGAFGVAAADLDKDGNIDLAVTDNSSAANAVSIFINNGAGTFATKVDYSTGTNPTGISTPDLDLDGDPDLAVGSGGASNKLSIFMNQTLSSSRFKVLSGDATATAFNVSNTGSATFQTSTNATTGFVVLNASGVPQFTVDTSNSAVYIGNPTADSTGALLVLDTKNTSGDPTGVNGALYYNSSNATFRCYENSLWKDCLGVPKPNSRRTVTAIANGTSTTWSVDGDVVTQTNVGTPTVSAQAATTTAPAGISYQTSGTSGDEVQVAGNTNYDFDASPIYQTHVSISATTSVRFWAGLTNLTAAGMFGSDSPTGRYAAFRYSTNASDANWKCVTDDNNASANVVDSGIAISTSYTKLEIFVDNANSRVIFKINGAVVCNTSTRYPGAGNLARYVNGIETLSAATRTMTLPWVYIESDQ